MRGAAGLFNDHSWYVAPIDQTGLPSPTAYSYSGFTFDVGSPGGAGGTVHYGAFGYLTQDFPSDPRHLVLIPAGPFTMGDLFNDWPYGGAYQEIPAHTVHVSAFYMNRTEVTKELWDEVYQWATSHGYTFEQGAQGNMNWNGGYRLPTEAERAGIVFHGRTRTPFSTTVPTTTVSPTALTTVVPRGVFTLRSTTVLNPTDR